MPQSDIEANTLLALQTLQNKPKLSTRRAANIYQVNEHRLRRRQQGIQSRRDTMPNSRKLSNLEEDTLLEFIVDLDSRGYPPRLSGVEQMANRLLDARDAPRVSTRWAMNFVKRQPLLKIRFQRRYDYKRAKCEDPTVIRN
jgi:hypothetical protein